MMDEALRRQLESIAVTGFTLNDIGNAERFETMHGRAVRYMPGGSWHAWDGRRWRYDRDGQVMRYAKETARAIYLESKDCQDDDEAERIAKWAIRSASEPRLRAMVSLAESATSLIALPEHLDAHPMKLTVNNGTIDLRTGKLEPHGPDDLITHLAPVDYIPDARSDAWNEFLVTITGGDRELEKFLQRVIGYTITGDTSEEVLLFPHGPTATGKSTFMETVKTVLGDYASTADFETFLRRRGDGGVRNDIARLAGARLVVSLEVDEGKRLAEGLIKTLTGGDTVAARFMYHEHFEFTPRFKLWLVANHRPKVNADDDAMWRRIVQIPFTNMIPENRRDPGLKQRFKSDRGIQSAVLAWAVQGCLDWKQHGLQIPESVRDYTDEYRKENDPLANWIADECDLGPSHWTPARDLRQAYEDWCQQNGSDPIGKGKTWGDALRTRGCKDGNQGKRGSVRGWSGISLTTTVSQ